MHYYHNFSSSLKTPHLHIESNYKGLRWVFIIYVDLRKKGDKRCYGYSAFNNLLGGNTIIGVDFVRYLIFQPRTGDKHCSFRKTVTGPMIICT